MWLRCLEISRDSYLISCHRWTVAVPFLLYLSLFLLTRLVPVPLRSSHSRILHTSKRTLALPDHLEAVRIERDGEINKKFHKEVVIGDKLIAQDPATILEDVFNKADTDKNKFLDLEELTSWINVKIQEHISGALRENIGLFAAIDISPKNGMISWDEYHSYFLKQKGFDDDYVDNHDNKHKGLPRTLKESIMRDRAAWSEAAKTDPEHLTVDEFLAFRHPESSHVTILTLVDELFEKFDRDGDEILTEEEFSKLHSDGEGESDTVNQGEEERRKEFREVIDRDKNGKADRMELVMYIDPKNPRHAREEAETLMSLSDVNHDRWLSLEEMLNKMDLFLGSKMVDTAGSFHDEF